MFLAVRLSLGCFASVFQSIRHTSQMQQSALAEMEIEAVL